MKERCRTEGCKGAPFSLFVWIKKEHQTRCHLVFLRLDSSPCKMRSEEMFWGFAYLICFNKFLSNWNTVGVETLQNHLRRSDYCWSSSALARSEGHKSLRSKEAQTVKTLSFQRTPIGSLSAYSKIILKILSFFMSWEVYSGKKE